MKSSLPNPTKEELKRWRIMQDIGCIACVLNGRLGVPGDIHHILSGGKRISHSHTVCLDPYHHRGVGWTPEIEQEHGPSLAFNQREFRIRFGTESELLEIQNELIKKYSEVTGNDYTAE